MPRLTRRTLASKKEDVPAEQAQPTRSGGRGKKDKSEPVEEPLPIGESKTSRSARGKETSPKAEAPKSNAARSSRRGKKEEEPEDEIEEQEAPPPKRAARGGRGKKDEVEEKAAPPKREARGGRGKKEELTEDAEEDDAPPPPKKVARGGRGKKQDEPEEEKVEEEVAPPKRAARGGRGKKQEEPEEEKEEEGPPKRAARGGRGKKEEPENEEEEEAETSSPKKPAPKGRGKATKGRGSRASQVEEEEEVAEEEMKVPAVEAVPKGRQSRTPAKAEVTPTAPSSGGRRSSGRGKKEEAVSPAETTPTRSSRRGAAAVVKDVEKEVSEMQETDKKTEETEELPQKDPEDSAEKTDKDEDAEEKMEVDENEPEAAKIEEEQKVAATTEEVASVTQEVAATKEEAAAVTEEVAPVIEKEAPVTEEKMQEEEKDNNRKRKLDDESEEESSSKKARVTEPPVEESPSVEETTPMEAIKEEDAVDTADFVIVNKEDLPPADSKEVEDALPPPVEEKPETATEEPPTESEPEKVEEIVKEPSPPTLPAAPVVVPLTEAEITKQYNPTIRDRDENSSMMVEVGSEAASDITNLSRNMDVSEVTSMDVTSATDQAGLDESNISAASSESTEALSSSSKPTDLTDPTPSTPSETQPKPLVAAEPAKETTPVVEVANSTEAVSSIPLPPESSEVESQSQSPPASAPAPIQQSSSPGIPQATPVSVPPSVDKSPARNTIPELQLNSIPLPPDVNMSNSTPTPSSPQQTLPPSVPLPVIQNATTQNGNCQPTEKVAQSVPLHTSTPARKTVVLDSSYVPSSPSIVQRKFISNPSFPVELMDPAFCFSVVTYNILADCHMRRYDYSYTESQYLEQSHRHNLLLKELDYLDGDIVCLQEVGAGYYQTDLLPAMNSRGYQGMFKKRTQDWYDEGEATFVKSSKFEVLSHHGLSLKDLAYEEIEAAGLSGDVSRAAKKYMDRADVVLVCKLLSKKTGKHLTVGNIHVAFDPKAPDVQCIEVASAVKELVSRAGSDLNPYIICGDFNSDPDTPAYQLAKDGYLSDTHIRNLQNIQSMDNTEGTVCKIRGSKARDPEEQTLWLMDHKESCHANYSGSSGGMEAEAAKVLWGRSMDYGLRYTTLIGDGDSKTFNAIQDLNPYNGVEVKKAECVNHVAKRLGTALRNLVNTEKKRGVTLGGRGSGTLTQSRSIIHYLWKAFQHTSSNMKSAYETSVGKEPVVTSKNNLVKACLDYVFYSSSTLYTLGALETLDPPVIEATGGLPTKDIPSDHISVKAVFRLKD